MPSRWVLGALVIFIGWKLFLVTVLWADRTLPPEPDDSLIYTAHIYSVVHCPTFLCNYPTISLQDQSGAAYLTYRLFWGLLARVTDLSPITVFYASFYIGTVLMAFALLAFLRRLTTNVRLQAFSLLMLALFSGGGSYHGFFWVVPSFFALVLFLLIAALVMDGWPRHRWVLVVLTPLFVLTHPIAPYLTLALAGYWLLYAALTRSWQRGLLKSTLLVAALVAATFIPQQLLLHQSRFLQPPVLQQSQQRAVSPAPTAPATADDPPPAGVSPAETAPATADGPPPAAASPAPAWLPGWPSFTTAYLRWVVPTPLALIPFFGFIAVLAYYRQYRVLAWYATALALAIVALLDPNGQRMLLLLWPLTFVLYAWGFWYTGRYLVDHTRPGVARAALASGLASAGVFFVVVNAGYSYLFALGSQSRENISVDPAFTTYLLQHTTPRDPVAFQHKALRAYSLNTPLIDRPLIEASKKHQAKYYIVYDADRRGESHPPLLRFLDTLAVLLRSPFAANHAARYGTSYTPLPESLAEGQLILEHTAGPIKLYRNQDYPL